MYLFGSRDASPLWKEASSHRVYITQCHSLLMRMKKITIHHSTSSSLRVSPFVSLSLRLSVCLCVWCVFVSISISLAQKASASPHNEKDEACFNSEACTQFQGHCCHRLAIQRYNRNQNMNINYHYHHCSHTNRITSHFQYYLNYSILTMLYLQR